MTILSPIEKLNHTIFDENQLHVYIKRDDLIHPIISGNKWRKLKYNLKQAKTNGYEGIMSFGGAYSNHIHALAYACQQHQIASVGIIRGENHYQSNATLSQAQKWGMKLTFVSRAEYKRRQDPSYISTLQNHYPNHLIIPEGGSNELALGGVGEIISELSQQLTYDTLILPVGSGGTIAGLIKADNNKHRILGIAVLKQADYLKNDINTLINKPSATEENWQLLTNYHGGGYGTFSIEAAEKIAAFSKQNAIPFEPIYSGKMLLACLNLAEQGYFAKNERIVLLHTGGIQGLVGLAERGKINSTQWHWPPGLSVH